MHIYLRHGNDEVRHPTFKHDHSLNSKSATEYEIINFTKKLIKKYGYPSKIYCSPFKRARATVRIMKKYLPHTEIIIDSDLSRYFTKKEQLNPSVREYTMKYNPPLYENKQEFQRRVDRIERHVNQQRDVCWCITHYLVIKYLCKKHQINIPRHMPFLWYTSI